MTDLNHRWLREVTVPLCAEEIAALMAEQPRDQKGQFATAEDVLRHHEFERVGTTGSGAQKWHHPTTGYEVITSGGNRESRHSKVQGAAWSNQTHAATPQQLHEQLLKYHMDEHASRITGKPTPMVPGSLKKQRSVQRRGASERGEANQRALRESIRKETADQYPHGAGYDQWPERHSAEALLGPLYDAAHQIEAMLDNQPRGEDGKWTKKPDAKRWGHSKTVTGPKCPHCETLVRARPILPKAKYKCSGCGKVNSGSSLTGSGIKHAAEEIAALFMGAGHDVSGEARDKGKFAKTPGAGAANEPTGSPLDPATGAKPPPAEHEVHKSNMDLHSKAAKTYNALVKQHLDLAKIALSPEDRARHIESARQHKQTAAHHTEQAGMHAEKMSAALQKAMQSVPTLPTAGAQGAPGARPSPPGAAPAPAAQPNKTAQNITGGIGSTVKQVIGSADKAINANEQPGMITEGAGKGIDAARKAVHQPNADESRGPSPANVQSQARKQLQEQLKRAQQAGAQPTIDSIQQQLAKLGPEPQPGDVQPDEPWGAPPNSVKSLPTEPKEKYTTGQNVKPLPPNVVADALKPRISHTTPSGQDIPASTGSGISSPVDPSVIRERERQAGIQNQGMNRPLDPKKLEEARRQRDATSAAMGQPPEPSSKEPPYGSDENIPGTPEAEEQIHKNIQASIQRKIAAYERNMMKYPRGSTQYNQWAAKRDQYRAEYDRNVREHAAKGFKRGQ